MTIFVKLIADYSVWLYLVLGLVAFLFLRAHLVARRERDNAIFALERESASGRMAQAIIGLLVTLILIGGVFYTSQTLVEEIPLPEITPTPTTLIVLPPSPTPPPLLPTPTPTDTPRPRPTLLPVETTTPTPEAAVGVLANCPNPGVRISEPGTGAMASGVIQIIGSANIPDFWYYKFEFRGNGFGDWTFIQRFDNPISGGILGAWDTRSVPSGDYEFRLVVVEKTGNYPEPCVLLLSVQN
ncbi:MAG: hypothetical protein JSV81_13855 [Anaerolineales bacterium]|nr:MAG: hypothetical protein JSV81_13855 [Anaerolineales bacterium]